MREQCVLITGTSQGIGEAIALKFLREGYTVVGMDRNPDTSLASYFYPNQFEFHQVDVSKDILPDLDKDVAILINNAGTQESEDDVQNNFTSAYRVTEKYGIQKNIKSILMISSASALTGAEFPLYCASKGAMNAYGKNVAQRVAAFGATCNNLCPGGVYTPLNEHITRDTKLHKKVIAETLLKRWASAEEIADWAYFLTVENKFCTAQDILVDGGEAAKSNFIW